jgi:predicted amidohydrolase
MKLKVGICQVNNNDSFVQETINEQVKTMNDEDPDIDLVILPECFNAPYDIKKFRDIAEPRGSESNTYRFLKSLAIKYHVNIIGGSFITKDKDNEGNWNYYNTCYCFDNKGNELGVYDKMHLFDIAISDIKYQESKVLTAGSTPLIINIKDCKIGIGICFDLRFQEMAKYYRNQDCHVICYPGAFTMTTGDAHYELLLRSHALNNQLYTIGVAPARDESASYVTWSNSTIIDPWGKVYVNMGNTQGYSITELDMKTLRITREMIPLKTNSFFKD